MHKITEKFIKTANIIDLKNELVKTFERELFDLRFVDVSKELLLREELTINDLKDFITIDHEACVYIFPFVDERESFDFRFLNQKVYPIKEFFWHINTEISERSLGLVDLTFTINKISLKKTDERFENIQTVFKDVKNFYYDFEKEKYIQVNKKQLDNEQTAIYLKRERLYYLSLERLEKEYLSYLEALEQYKNYFDRAETITAKQFEEYFKQFLKFSKDEFEKLELQLIISRIDENHLSVLKHAVSVLNLKIDKMFTEIKKIENRLLSERFTDESMRRYTVIYTELLNLRKLIMNLFENRDVKTIRKSKTFSLSGYVVKENKAYRNIVYHEIIKTEKNYTDSDESRRKEENEINKSLQNNSSEKEVKKQKSLFTEQEMSEIKNQLGAEKRTYLLQLLNKKASEKIIDRKQIPILLEKYYKNEK